jgi:hypothetical protein
MIDSQNNNTSLNLANYLVVLAVAMVLLNAMACVGEPQNLDNQKVVNKYFDLAGFVQAQKEAMSAASSSCTKIVSVNEKNENKVVNSDELEQELEVFIDADINKPAWSDKYKIDSLKVNGILQQLKYTTIDPKLKTRVLEVVFDSEGNVSEIHVLRDVKSVIADTYNEMYLWPGKGYEINTIQAVALSDTTRLQVKVSCQN